MQWKTALERAIRKIAEATGDLIGNKITYKITSVSKSPKKITFKWITFKNRYE